VSAWRCAHCGSRNSLRHQDEHPGLCCDCFDLSWGMPLAQINAERAARDRPPITREWGAK
jgi:hypothetical protein